MEIQVEAVYGAAEPQSERDICQDPAFQSQVSAWWTRLGDDIAFGQAHLPENTSKNLALPGLHHDLIGRILVVIPI